MTASNEVNVLAAMHLHTVVTGINAIEGRALRADRSDSEVRPHVTVEAVLVHAEIAQPNEARQELRLGRLETRCHAMPIMEISRKKVSARNRGKFGRNDETAEPR